MRTIASLTLFLLAINCMAQTNPSDHGRFVVTHLAENAVRIQYVEDTNIRQLTDWVYVSQREVPHSDISVRVDSVGKTVRVYDKSGREVFTALQHQLTPTHVDGEPAYEARMAFASPSTESLYGLGQFQDGYLNIRGLSRRLTQVNTQISVPMLISSEGYGLLWNNDGLTDFNPADQQVKLTRMSGVGDRETVDVTSTEGGKQEVREHFLYEGDIDITEAGDYALLLDVGQKMARKHHLSIDGQTVVDMQNLWLPPTASALVTLEKGTHHLAAELTRDDSPVLYYQKVGEESVLSSPVARAVDYTVFVGNADEVMASYRELTGAAPMVPQWALGYIHCRERFHSQEELLGIANRFRQEHLPVDMMVQDWQYWGKYGWNAMAFDEDFYPDPRRMTDSLHAMNMRLMVSVWSKIDKSSEVGKMMLSRQHYIPGTDWIDFFSPQAAGTYWEQFSKRLLPLGIDAWWQDATEPENDDLTGRRVMRGQLPGEWVRNIYPLMVCKTVYEGLGKDAPGKRHFILTRSGFPGIQRYGAALWSGDVGNDWETLRRQITGGLGLQAAGIPWWTYDAGGFFRPARQYDDQDYIERMLRWIETAVYLPLMRVHGYMSDTEPWKYGDTAQKVIAGCLRERYRLLPYLYSHAAEVSLRGGTLMRPLVFDYPHDRDALAQKHEYMFGKSMLVCPITEPQVSAWHCYLPANKSGWYDLRDGHHYDGGQYVDVKVDLTRIPVFVRAGAVMPWGTDREYVSENPEAPLEISIYPGTDASFTLYEDDGVTCQYEQGACSTIPFVWNEESQTMVIGKRQGAYPNMPRKRQFIVSVLNGPSKKVTYKGKRIKLNLMK